MRILRILFLTAIVTAGAMLVPQEASASSSVGFFLGYNRYHPAYHYYHRPFYRPFYRPYFGGFYNPYYYGFGHGYGYGYGGYGYGYPYSSYRRSLAGEIRTEVKPKEARVFLDGDYVGVADDFDSWWQRLEVSPGRHRIVFRSPGFEPYVVDLRVGPERDSHIKYSMRPGQDQIADLEMRLPRENYGRENYGNDDRLDRRLDRRERKRDRYQDRDRDRYDDRRNRERYEERDRYENRDRDRYDERDRDEDRDRDRYDERDTYPRSEGNGAQDKPYFGDDDSQRLTAGRHTLTLSVEPSDATVYVDGNYYGTANDNGNGELQILLAEGVHRVEVVRPGHNSFSQDVTVSKNGENRLSVTLRKK
jgi:hypothetical protein